MAIVYGEDVLRNMRAERGMADITMCNGFRCPRLYNCYRFTAEPSRYQSWFAETPLKADQTCDHFWDNSDRLEMKPTAKPDAVDSYD